MFKQNIHKLIKNYFVYYVTIIKLILLVLFSSDYSLNLFYKFLLFYVQNGGNPWEFFYKYGIIDAFPYHALMLYILTPFTYIAKVLNFYPIFKLPLLIADILMLIIFLKLFPNKKKHVYLYYFLNPIVIYITYIHSQLDIIPTLFMFYAIYLITQKKYSLSAFSLGLGLSTKFHIIVALPLIIFYIFKNSTFKNVCKYIFISLITLLILDSPYLVSQGFINMVIFNKKQNLLFDSFYSIGNLKLLLPIFAILAIYLHFFNQPKINDDLLYFYFGLLFTATIFFIYPSPGWYLWMIPFVVIYFVKSKGEITNQILFFIFSFTYLLFFIFFYQSEYKDILFLSKEVNLKIHNDKLCNTIFTFLEVILLSIIYVFYKYGIKSNAIYKKQTNLIIGIGGDSGAGKSTLMHNLQLLLQNNVLLLEGDGEHKWERGDINWNRFTHLDPKANFLHRQAEILYNLKHNQFVYRRDYDHKTGKFTEPIKVEPKELIIISGLHTFYLPKQRKVIDIKIYLDTDEKLKQNWKILRDTKERNYDVKKIIEQIELRKNDAQKFIYPQKEFADIIINYFSIDNLSCNNNELQNLKFGAKITFNANIHIENLLNKIDNDIEWNYNDDLKTQYIKIYDINNTGLDFQNLANELIENLYEIIDKNAIWLDKLDGFIQLIILIIISEKLKEERI